MIVYQSTKSKFQDDILSNDIENIILKSFQKKLNKGTTTNEVRSWRESLSFMDRVLQDSGIPDDSGIAIEFQVPQTSKRIDFIISGKNENNIEHAILVELKQWQQAQLTEKDGIVVTMLNSGYRETSHPSYQVWAYATLLEGFNQTVYEENIQLKPCAYLHNYEDDNVITHEFYKEYIDKAPLFLKPDALKLRNFIKQFVKYGDKSNIIYRIDAGKIKPSKTLADSMVSMLKGNKEFVMVDDQKIVYETALSLAKKSSDERKHVLIVEGGPGTGKSVVAVNLLVQVTKLGLLAQYVSKNAAPRAVYESKLTGTLKATVIRNLFKGSGSYISTLTNSFDALIVDEAHRLNEKSGLYGVDGENQIKEIINSAKFSVFFVDEDQKVTLNDIGEKETIRKWANLAGAEITELELSSQFRCNGSDGYLSWLDNVLQIRETANERISDLGYDFQIFDSPSKLRDVIFEKNKANNKARMVAGYCWKWVSKQKPELFDINLEDFDFQMKWNLATDGSLWIVEKKSVNEMGCIHTCQGLEVDYIGVVIGDDLIVRNNKIITNAAMRATSDSSVKGYKKLLERDPKNGADKLEKLIKNTYRTLMTRGMKGCYVYFTDKETELYFRSITHNESENSV